MGCAGRKILTNASPHLLQSQKNKDNRKNKDERACHLEKSNKR